NKRLHVEMCLIRLCYLLQAIQPADVKKNTSSVAPAPAAQPKPAPQPAPYQPQGAAARVQEPEKPQPAPQQPKPQPAAYVAPPPAKVNGNGNDAARRISSDLLSEIDDVLNNAVAVEEVQKELNADLVHGLYEKYIQGIQAGNKMVIYAQLKMMDIELHPEHEVRLVCPSALTETYARSQQNEILEYFRRETGVLVRVTTEVRENEEVIAGEQQKVLSKQDMYEAMAAKNPSLAYLKDALGLHLEY